MSKLETQINQIYLISPETKKTSLVLYEERLREPLHLFVVFELTGIKKKTEANELKKISDTVLNCFRNNQKMPISSLFEAALAQINQELGNIAHKGAKSWIGKLSAAIVLKSDVDISLANTGAASVWLKRKNELTEILPAEKKGDHPLKIFQNFSSGRVRDNDSLVVTTSNLFNYVSLPLLTQVLSGKTLADACEEISKILIDSSKSDDGFAAFFLQFDKTLQTATTGSKITTPASNKIEDIKDPERIEEISVPKPAIPEVTIYAPLPEDITPEEPKSKFKLPSLENLKVKLQKPQLPKLSLDFFRNFNKSSISRRFFLIAFTIFLLLFIANVFVWRSRANSQKNQKELAARIESVMQTMGEAESALIYKNDDQAIRILDEAKDDISAVKKLDETKGQQLEAQFQLLADRINRVTSVPSPRVVAEIKHSPIFLARAGSGFAIAGKNSNSLANFTTSYTAPVLLNGVEGDITGLTHVPNNGNWVATANKIYRVDESLKEFVSLFEASSRNLQGLKVLTNNRVYTADLKNNQILRMPIESGRPGTALSILKGTVDLTGLKDFGVDTDVYLLYPDRIRKYVAGNEQAFRMPRLTETMTGAEKISVGSNLYILEPSKKRLLMISRTGALVNQIYFPNSNELKDFYVNETERRITLINGNQLIEIVF